MGRTWKPKVAGTLDIFIGGLMFIPSLLLFCAELACALSEPTGVADILVVLLYMAPMIFSLLAIIGGIYALQRKKWRWALAGSACAVLQ